MRGGCGSALGESVCLPEPLLFQSSLFLIYNCRLLAGLAKSKREKERGKEKRNLKKKNH